MLALAGCRKTDAVGPQRVPTCNVVDTLPGDSSRVFIINEGNFTWGNASLSIYDPVSNSVLNNAFSNANNRPLGDVGQSIAFSGANAWLVVNNSGKIEVIDQQSLSAVTTITGLQSPREVLFVNRETAFATDLYANAISVIDRATATVVSSIPVPGWTETMLPANDLVFVAGTENNNVYTVDPAAELLLDSIPVNIEPNSMVLDANHKLWVLCSGGFQEGPAAVIRINPATNSVEQVLEFSDLDASPTSLTIDAAGERLMWINGGVYSMTISATALPAAPLIDSGTGNFYRVAIDPANNDFYVSDPGSFVEEGKVLRFSENAVLIETIPVGILPGAIAFGP